ncbi:isochorismatase family protein [Devriesea agamarum]|uniref:isochorismatase family protein n=1 Tax=Devriesea agamarum TaxID=472569 RepID=UPI00071CBC70|nr:isochorismatase family protein [Devriesea agamarum]
MPRALLVVDAQNDFTEGGPLGVEGATGVFERIAAHLGAHSGDYAVIIATQDWHIDPGSHWADEPDYVNSWPRHCAAGSDGAELNGIISAALARVEAIPVLTVVKGEYEAAYSGFEGHVPEHAGEQQGHHLAGQSLDQALRAYDIDELDIVGLATDYCVRATALDAIRHGYTIRLLTDMVTAIDASAGRAVCAEISAAGGQIA